LSWLAEMMLFFLAMFHLSNLQRSKIGQGSSLTVTFKVVSENY
jgi:hypothetical protein